jgi:hypothetical protein
MSSATPNSPKCEESGDTFLIVTGTGSTSNNKLDLEISKSNSVAGCASNSVSVVTDAKITSDNKLDVENSINIVQCSQIAIDTVIAPIKIVNSKDFSLETENDAFTKIKNTYKEKYGIDTVSIFIEEMPTICIKLTPTLRRNFKTQFLNILTENLELIKYSISKGKSNGLHSTSSLTNEDIKLTIVSGMKRLASTFEESKQINTIFPSEITPFLQEMVFALRCESVKFAIF